MTLRLPLKQQAAAWFREQLDNAEHSLSPGQVEKSPNLFGSLIDYAFYSSGRV